MPIVNYFHSVPNNTNNHKPPRLLNKLSHLEAGWFDYF